MLRKTGHYELMEGWPHHDSDHREIQENYDGCADPVRPIAVGAGEEGGGNQ
jgi:hypothetical protein